MNLRGIANSVSSVVNPNTPVSLKRSTGYTMGPGMKQVPSYADAVTGSGQIQALDNAELELTAGLNLQGDVRAIYLYGSLAGALRPDGKGGDIITVTVGRNAGVWLVTKVLESWPDWTKAVIVKQVNP